MPSKICTMLSLLMLMVPVISARGEGNESTIRCRAMEVFVSQRVGTTAVIFHQRDKADGPRLGELLLAHSGEEVEFETTDGHRHRATVARVKSCFGRGLLLFGSSETKVSAGDEVILHFSLNK